eukprot:m.1209617 g.1209617  ORF g.1209617 m.1209617 type:complete len:160 (-) comp24591_c2_seq2:870-1349(-)
MHAVRAQSNSNTTHPMNRTRHIFLLADVRHHPPSDAKAFCVHVPSQLHTWGVLHTSGFRDRQRIHLRQLIMLIGAQYTAALTRDNTFLIATEPAGAKYEKAREWGVPVISEQWIEDVCSVWRLIPCIVGRTPTLCCHSCSFALSRGRKWLPDSWRRSSG